MRSSARHIAHIAALATLVAAGGCIGDEKAPICFFPDGEGGCLTPPILTLRVECSSADPASLPLGAVNATYSSSVNIDGGSGFCDETTGECTGYTFSADNLPDGLMLDPTTGLITGTPTTEGSFGPIEITVRDNQFSSSEDSVSCNMDINPALNVNRLRTEPMHCLELGQDVNDFLDGGDGSAFRCDFPERNNEQDSCLFGDGNGVVPDGIATNYDGEFGGNCSSSGTITEDTYGAWVWVFELTQSDYTIRVPVCASNDSNVPHTITIDYANYDTNPGNGLEPMVVDYVPDVSSNFGGAGDPFFTIEGNDLCMGNGCNFFGFSFAVSCSPLDPPFSLDPGMRLEDGGGNPLGFTHNMSADFPAVDDKFGDGVWVANWRMDYCNSDMAGPCEGDQLATSAQTQFNLPVLGWPVLD